MLTGRDEVVLVRLDSIHHSLEVSEVGDAFVGLAVHHQGRLHKRVAPAYQEVRTVLLQRHLHPC